MVSSFRRSKSFRGESRNDAASSTPRHPSIQRIGVCSSIVRLQLFLQYFHRLLHTATVLCYVLDVDSAVFVDTRIPASGASDTAAIDVGL